ncbi:TPA: hypothetical protein ACQ2H2_002827, partial [Klebsiella pneumoniae]
GVNGHHKQSQGGKAGILSDCRPKANVCQRLLIKIYTVNMRNEIINILYAKSHHSGYKISFSVNFSAVLRKIPL